MCLLALSFIVCGETLPPYISDLPVTLIHHQSGYFERHFCQGYTHKKFFQIILLTAVLKTRKATTTSVLQCRDPARQTKLEIRRTTLLSSTKIRMELFTDSPADNLQTVTVGGRTHLPFKQVTKVTNVRRTSHRHILANDRKSDAF